MHYGQPLAGTELAPAALRKVGRLNEAIASLGWRVTDAGDVEMSLSQTPAQQPAPPPPPPSHAKPPPPPIRNAREVGQGCKGVHAAVYSACKGGTFALTLGGDHSVALGSVSGVLRARPDVRVIWVDAHADVNEPSTSPSGNVHGMPLSFLMRLIDPCTYEGFEWLRGGKEASGGQGKGEGGQGGSGKGEGPIPALLPSRLVYIGLRDVDAGERKLIKRLGIKSFTMQDVDRLGIGAVMDEALDHLLLLPTHAHAHPHPHPHARGAASPSVPPRVRQKFPLHLSFDIDAVDPLVAPSTGTAVPGGLSWREGHYICEAAAATGLLGSMDMVEVNPAIRGEKGSGEETVKAAVHFISSALGKTILGGDDEE